MQAQCDVAFSEIESADNITTTIRRGGAEVIEEIAVPWCDLWRQASEDPFYRPEWVLAYIRSFSPKARVWLVTAFEGERLVAVLPLVKELGLFRGLPVRQLRGAANVHSCRFDLLRAPGALGVAATKAIWSALEHTQGWDLIQIPYTPADGNAINLLQHAEQAGFSTAFDLSSRSRYISVVDCTDGKLRTDPPLSYHFRSELRRRARRLEEVLGARLELKVLRKADPSQLQQFFELERSGWKGREGTAIASRADTRMFYEDAACIATDFGCFRLALLRAHERLIAAAFGVAISKTFLPLKISYDEVLSRGAPGHQLLARILQYCSDEELAGLEFGGDDEDFKRQWTPHTRDYLRIYIFGPREYGRCLRFHKLQVVPRIKNILSQARKMFRSKEHELMVGTQAKRESNAETRR